MNAMRQDAQKQSRKFCRSKEGKNSETHPEKPEKGETGCVPGAGEGCSRYGRVGKPEIRTKMHQIAMQHMKKENRRNPSVFAGFVAGAEGLVSAAASVGAGRSPQATSAPRHAPRGAQPCLVAKTFRSMTKNSATAKAVALFLAGAEGLSLACRLGCCSLVGSAQHRPRREPRPVRSRAPLALAHPSARGFGVDVETAHKEQERGSVARFLLQDENVRCWFGAFRFSRSKTRIESPLEISLRMSSLKSYICMYTEE